MKRNCITFEGSENIENVDKELASVIPSATQMGKVYSRLIINTLGADEDFKEPIGS